MQEPTVVIVGAGFSGVLTALNLLETAKPAVRVHLIERAERFGVGLAYGTHEPDHLLNVRAANMSFDPGQPDDFMSWLSRRRQAPPDPFAFASRAEFGVYVQHRLQRVIQGPDPGGLLELTGDEVIGIDDAGGRLSVRLAMGRGLEADAIVLATGNAPPSNDRLPDPSFAHHPAYIRDPWVAGALNPIGPDEAVLLLGTGLTMIDVMASLDTAGHRGPVLALSRRGLLPRAHAPVAAGPPGWSRLPGEPLSRGLRRFRSEFASAQDWRAPFDALRPGTHDLWRGMTQAERRRFLRHMRPWWDVHRHRLAPAMAVRLEAWLAGRLTVAAGRLETLQPDRQDVRAVWRRKGEQAREQGVFAHVVNCTGPQGDPNQSRDPLIQQLLQDGRARADPLGLGLDVTEDARLIGGDGLPHPRLFAIGPAARGALWEVTAVPDIRLQARSLAATIRRDLPRASELRWA